MTTVEKEHEFRLFCQGKSNRRIYKETCAELGIRRNSAMNDALGTEPDRFDMKSLDVRANMLGADGVRSLFKVIAANKDLEHLGLSGQGLDDRVFLDLIEIIRSHPSLSSVDVGENPYITNAACTALLSALRDNQMLCAFEVAGCSIAKGYQRRIHQLAAANDRLEIKFFDGDYLQLKKIYMQLDNGNDNGCITMTDLINSIEIPKVILKLTAKWQALVDGGTRVMNENIPINTFLDFAYPSYKSGTDILNRVKQDDLESKVCIDNQFLIQAGLDERKRQCKGLHLIRIRHVELTAELVDAILGLALEEAPGPAPEQQMLLSASAILNLPFTYLKKAVQVVVPAPLESIRETRMRFRLAPEIVHQILSHYHTRDEMPVGELLEQRFETSHQALALKVLAPTLQAYGLPVQDMPMTMQEVVCFFEEYYDKIIYQKSHN
eukprot:TRINITY_DN20348_c0_g1_i1.p1 TRINITY_DN20348_c0_g1~~TRINITY_DN20348_c0_g1_i1.p1  ORF type:complete len:437 (+),score=196.55 TRINITY_DN20348_c0_g1_i1:73-1383(+)